MSADASDEVLAVTVSRVPDRTRWLLAAIAILALALRVAYYFGSVVDSPVRGDIVQYVTYAWNLVHHGVFSSSAPGSAEVIPDGFRGPGYPAFLAFWMAVAGDRWYGWVVAVQMLIGAALAPMTALWARHWLSQRAALFAGFLVALWPHLIVFASTLLSETLFAFMLLMFFWLLASSIARQSMPRAIAAGVSMAVAYLVNPVAAIFPFLAAGLLVLRGQRRIASAMVSVALLGMAGWSVRNAMYPDMTGAGSRAAVNLVEGSWPLYHAAYNDQNREPMARQVMQAIGAEERLMVQSPAKGLRAMADRMREYPVGYARWYLVEKPYALWSWRVRIGWGDVYFLRTLRSPFEQQWPFRAIRAVFFWGNPVFFALALAACLIAWWHRSDRTPGGLALQLAVGFFLYVTAVHTLLQADPRYAVAYRPIEVVLAVTALVWIRRKITPVR